MAREPSGAGSAAAWIDHLRSRINLGALERETRKSVQLIVAGPRGLDFLNALRVAGPFDEDAILDSLSGPGEASASRARAAVYCPEAEGTNGELASVADLPFPVFVVRTGDGGTLDEGRLATSPASSKPARGAASVYYVSAMTLPELRRHLLPGIVRAYHGDEVALAAAVPAFRPSAAAKLTSDCAMTSLKIAAASALADHVPVLGLITGGIASAGDTIAITALQMQMLLRIAAAYGKKPEFARILELMPVVGGGYGWRALARELSGFIPVAGIPIKAAIAYAGTLVVGQAATHYYETGMPMSPKRVRALYRDASERAKAFATRFIRPKRKSLE